MWLQRVTYSPCRQAALFRTSSACDRPPPAGRRGRRRLGVRANTASTSRTTPAPTVGGPHTRPVDHILHRPAVSLHSHSPSILAFPLHPFPSHSVVEVYTQEHFCRFFCLSVQNFLSLLAFPRSCLFEDPEPPVVEILPPPPKNSWSHPCVGIGSLFGALLYITM